MPTIVRPSRANRNPDLNAPDGNAGDVIAHLTAQHKQFVQRHFERATELGDAGLRNGI
jgi:hypothetical protein